MEHDKMLLQRYKPHLNLELIYRIYQESLKTKKTSYVTYLIDTMPYAEKEKEGGGDIEKINHILTEMNLKPIKHKTSIIKNYDHMDTMQLLKYSESILTKNITNEDVDTLSNELKTRKDLFECFLKYSEGIKKFYSDLYYWFPGREISDICTLVLSVISPNETVLKYKNFLAESIMTEKSCKTNMLELLKNRISSSHFCCIDVMNADIELFPTVPSDEISTKIISHDYWCEGSDNCDYFPSWLADYFGLENCYEEKDKKYLFKGCMSFIEVEIKGDKILELTIPLYYYDDLMNGCQKYKSYWFEKGIIDKDGNIIL